MMTGREDRGHWRRKRTGVPKRPKARGPHGSPPEPEPHANGRVKRCATAQRIMAVLGRLNLPARLVLILRHKMRMPADGIAAFLGITEEAAQLLHLRALEEVNRIRGTVPPQHD